MGEIYEESLTLDHWRDAQDQPTELGCYRIATDALLTSEPITSAEPDEKEAEGYTGNAGCTVDLWYRRAAIVFWRTSDDETIRAHHDLSGACQQLTALARQEKHHPSDAFIRLATAIIQRYPEALPYHLHRSTAAAEDRFPTLLKALATTRAADLFERLADRVPVAAFTLCDAPLWKKLLNAFGTARCQSLVDRTNDQPIEECRPFLFDLLDAIWNEPDAAPLARRLTELLANLAPKPPASPGWNRPAETNPPGDPAEIRVPAREPGSLIPELTAFAQATLEAEIARPLEPYPDWTRPVPETAENRPPLIRELLTFLADPTESTHRFKRNQGDRSVIEQFIRSHQLDLDHRTEETSRPYSLICKKTEASFHRRRAHRDREIDLAEKLTHLA